MSVPKIANFICLFSFVSVSLCIPGLFCADQPNNDTLSPTILITILVRNKALILPYFLGYLEKVDYPRDRISLWIRSDHNIDDSVNILRTWLEDNEKYYHSVDVILDDSPETFSEETGLFDWSPSHYVHLIKLKEESLAVAKKIWADYIMFLDSDVLLINKNTFHLLMEEEKTVVAPMIETLGAYSNFWCGMNEQGYYKRTEDYLPIVEREKIGCFDVPMVHSAFLVDLRRKDSRDLTFDSKKLNGYEGPLDDIIVFAASARDAGVKMYVSNREPFGYMLSPLEKENTYQDFREQLLNLKIEMMVDEPELPIPNHLEHFVQKQEVDTLGLDQVYLINLDRRADRRVRMVHTFEELGVDVKLFPAVDGKALNDSFIEQMGIKMLPEYKDPYHKRPLTMGEIGCFLSHYQLWKDMIVNQHRTAIVFEDDLRFEPFFRKKVHSLLKDLQKIGLLWDLIYLGRKRLSTEGEPFVSGTTNLVQVDYSYWTLCYLITLEGAKKLVGAQPLAKMVPVDEYLPIMFDKHPEEVWKGYFPNRNLRAFSAHPLLVYPTHYVGEADYVSDTEDSDIAKSVIKLQRKDEL